MSDFIGKSTKGVWKWWTKLFQIVDFYQIRMLAKLTTGNKRLCSSIYVFIPDDFHKKWSEQDTHRRT